MKLLVQPDAGVDPILKAIREARRTIDVLVFRLDRRDIARALEAAVARGVNVRALTAHTNRGGAKRLRKLEMHLLEEGVTVSRTADDFIRYHGKMMIIDGCLLHVYSFNFTMLDIDKSRSFGLVTRNKKFVHEASKLFEADFNRQPYNASYGRFVVSPENSRDRLTHFIGGARKELLIYDPQVSDDAILKILVQRAKAGVDVKILGKVEAKWSLKAEKFPGRRLHTRAIIRDGRRAFLGSQSLRKLELDKRREIGIIVDDEKIVEEMQAVFMQDWALTAPGKKEAKKERKLEKAERKEEKQAAAVS